MIYKYQQIEKISMGLSVEQPPTPKQSCYDYK